MAEAFVALHPIAEQILMLYNTTDNEKPVFLTQGEYEKEYNYNQRKRCGICIGQYSDARF
jgi:hypothetical protein